MAFVVEPIPITPITIDIKEFTDEVEVIKIESDPDKFAVEGKGIFDTLMETATKHLIAQVNSGRIRGEDFATSYIQIYQATLSGASNIWLQKGVAEKQIEVEAEKSTRQLQIDLEKTNRTLEMQWRIALLENEIEKAKLDLQKYIAELQAELLKAQAEAEDAKKDLYKRQIQGFDEDYNQKILKIMMDSWAVGFSVSRDSFLAEGIPGPMQKGTIDDIFNKFVITEFSNFPDFRA